MADQSSFIGETSRDQRIVRLYRYWDESRGARSFPGRADIDSIDFTFALERVSIIEVHRDPLRFRYRLVSTHLTEHLGYEISSKYFEDIPEPSMREFARAFYERALERQGPLYETGSVVIGRHEWWHETLLLPLAADGETIDMFLIYRNTERPVAVAPTYRPA